MLPLKLAVADTSQVGEARRRASGLSLECGWRDSDVGKVELVVTELARNLVKHSDGGGELIVVPAAGGPSLTVLTLDEGPGIRNVSQALSDGYSTAGSPGTGLGAVRRLADEFDLYSSPGRGTAVLARLSPTGARARGPAHGMAASGLRFPMVGETECGDGLAWAGGDGRFLAFVVDGLGHGVMAAEAADTAVRTFSKNLHLPPERLMEAVHNALRASRGGVAAVAELRSDRQSIRYVGIGNINAVLHTPEGSRNLVSYNGTLGQEVRKFQAFDYPWTANTTLIMHSDGMSNRWDIGAYPGLERKSPALLAAVLYRDFARDRDDLSVLVARQWLE
ncbi:MAG TPA: ATP-binding SpoIIE family protein phosphatase [Trueperaceae bacterium]